MGNDEVKEVVSGPAVLMADETPVQRISTGSRLDTVDFFRGLGLWVVTLDHIDSSFVARITLWRWGFSDFAEVFAFLSGFVGAGAYLRALESGGWRKVWAKLRPRMTRLYLGHIASLCIVIGLLAIAGYFEVHIDYQNAYLWEGHEVEYLIRGLTLRYMPRTELLPLYLIAAPITALAVAGLRRRPRLTLAISIAVWLVSQLGFASGSFLRNETAWYFQPFAWQLLFVIGAAAAVYSEAVQRWIRKPWCIALAIAIVCFSLGFKVGTMLPFWRQHVIPGSPADAFAAYGTGKRLLEPQRLVHFLALASIVSILVDRPKAWLESRIARLIVICGQDSLTIYCDSIVAAVGASLILVATHGGWVLQVLVSAASVASITTLAWIRRNRPASRRPGL